jgi:hypothetical protein
MKDTARTAKDEPMRCQHEQKKRRKKKKNYKHLNLQVNENNYSMIRWKGTDGRKGMERDIIIYLRASEGDRNKHTHTSMEEEKIHLEGESEESGGDVVIRPSI